MSAKSDEEAKKFEEDFMAVLVRMFEDGITEFNIDYQKVGGEFTTLTVSIEKETK